MNGTSDRTVRFEERLGSECAYGDIVCRDIEGVEIMFAVWATELGGGVTGGVSFTR